MLRLLGMATRAGKVITGIELSEKAAKQGKAKLIVLAQDAKQSTVDIFSKFQIPTVTVLNKEILGKFTGKDYRSVAVVCDENFARAIQKESEEGLCYKK